MFPDLTLIEAFSPASHNASPPKFLICSENVSVKLPVSAKPLGDTTELGEVRCCFLDRIPPPLYVLALKFAVVPDTDW